MRKIAIIALLLLSAVGCATVGGPAGEADVRAHAVGANWELADKWHPMTMYEMTASTRIRPQWIAGGDAFWYRYLRSDGRRYWLVDPERAVKQPLFDRDAMAAELVRVAGGEHDAAMLDLRGLDVAADRRSFEFELGGARYRFDREAVRLAFVDSVRAEPAPDTPAWANLSPDGQWNLFARANDLYLARADETADHAVRLTNDGEYARSWGTGWDLVDDADDTPRAVDAIWSPDSRRFAIKRADLREVEDLWLVDHLAEPRPTLKTIKVPPVGGAVPQWELWVGECETGAMVQVRAERWTDQTLDDLFGQSVYWAPDSSVLFFQRRHRDYTKLDLCAADPASGAALPAIEERSTGMVYSQPPTPLPATGEALWWSMRDGWGHLYRYGLDGALRNRVTAGEWMVDEVVAADESAGVVFFLGMGREPGRNPYYRHLYRVNLDGTDLRLLTPADAEHECDFSPSKRYFLDAFSRADRPHEIVLRNADGEVVVELEKSDISRHVDAGWQAPEIFHVPGADGVTEQWGVMWKPFDFDPEKKYPIISRGYPGKQGEFVPRSFLPVDFETYLAQLGCIVVRYGNRGGTWERGLEYREYGRDDFRDFALADKRAVLEHLGAEHEWIDLDRVGIYGASSGGFLTVSAMLKDNDFYKVGVAMTAPNDPSLYFNHWVERYAGVEEIVGPDGATTWSADGAGNLALAGNLEGKLLMIYGEQDDNVHPLHLVRMADAFVKAGKRFDMFMIPGADHGLGSWQYRNGLIFDYFAEHLIGGGRESAGSLFVEQQ